jgi:hypothetical protein
LPKRVHVGTPEEIGLHVHLLHSQLALDNALMQPLVRRVEAARMTDHADFAGFLL